MMYNLNKVVGVAFSPMGIAILTLLLAGAWAAWKKSWRVPMTAAFAAAAWLWVWGTNVWSRALGAPLERNWLAACRAEAAPAADAIVLLGGGMCATPAAYPYPDMAPGADRVWHAARLYKAGKAPVIVPSGAGDRESTVPLLLDFGVPAEAIRVEDAARNTEENARFVEQMLTVQAPTNRPKALLVTSAWHMRRSLLMYARYAPGLDIVPAPADFENTVATGEPVRFRDFFPSSDSFQRNSAIWKELIGYWGYRLLRR